MQNNKVELTGRIYSQIEFSHSVRDEIFYRFTIEINRLSEISDKLIVIAPASLITYSNFSMGDTVHVYGQFRSHNNFSNVGNRLILTIFAHELEKTDNPDQNHIYLNGFLCKPPIFRKTPFGRKICDILLAINRAYNKSDYIPCIAWGQNAQLISELKVGNQLEINGRIQSRLYEKKLSETETETKTAYEVSISNANLL